MIDFFRNLNREQVQKLSIAVGAGIALLAALYYLLIAPARRSADVLQADIEATRREFQENQLLLKNADKVEARYRQVRNEFAEIIDEKLAPMENELSWVSSVVQDAAKRHGVELENLSGYGTSTPRPTSRNAPPPLLEEYGANLSLVAGYHEFGRFLAELERRLPYARLESVTMKPGKSTTEERVLAINLRYSFPRFTTAGFPLEERPQPDDDETETAEDHSTEPELSTDDED